MTTPITSDESIHLVALDPLRSLLEQALATFGVAKGHAEAIAEVLLDAEMRGYDDHGVYFLKELATWYRSGAMNPNPNIQVLRETPTSLLLDGDKGCAVVASHRAMAWSVKQARTHGLASAAIQNSGHFVAAAPYVTAAAKAGFIGLTAANVTPLMPPPGGKTRTLGTNPLAFAAPTGEGTPVVFDMATTGIAGFKARLAAQQGRLLPDGLVANAKGEPSNDPRDFVAGGLLLPVGGHKGFGLALMVEILSGVLTGAEFGRTAGITDGKEGHFFLALDPGLFIAREAFLERMDELVRYVKASDRMEGVGEVFVPGERGQRRAAQIIESGWVPLNDLCWNALVDVCGMVGLTPPETAA
ncbi:MAG: Ldh family oxidoreductase [Dehalococcoidia bacterium]